MYDAGPFPRAIYLETSVRCNARCVICPSPYLDRPDMSWETAQSVIDQCVGHPIDELHPFQYADPLVWKDLVRLLEYSREKLPGVRHILYTNAGLLTGDMSLALAPLVDLITFSLDGATKEVYEAHRPPLQFETVINNVLRFLEINEMAGHPAHTRAHFTFTNRNHHEMPSFRHFWEGKADEVTFHECDSRSEPFGGHERYYTQSCPEPCAQPFNGLFVHSNGNVTLCCVDARPSMVLGNLEDQSIEEVWNGAEFARIRAWHNAGQKFEIPLCKTCSVRN